MAMVILVGPFLRFFETACSGFWVSCTTAARNQFQISAVAGLTRFSTREYSAELGILSPITLLAYICTSSGRAVWSWHYCSRS
jgi:hypothetical protein